LVNDFSSSDDGGLSSVWVDGGDLFGDLFGGAVLWSGFSDGGHGGAVFSGDGGDLSVHWSDDVLNGSVSDFLGMGGGVFSSIRLGGGGLDGLDDSVVFSWSSGVDSGDLSAVFSGDDSSGFSFTVWSVGGLGHVSGGFSDDSLSIFSDDYNSVNDSHSIFLRSSSGGDGSGCSIRSGDDDFSDIVESGFIGLSSWGDGFGDGSSGSIRSGDSLGGLGLSVWTDNS